MRKIIVFSLAALLIFSSCELKEDVIDSTTNNNNTTSSITVKSPNGGESIMEGSSYNIQWTGTGVSFVSIQFSFDNGSSWYLIADSLENKGIYSWFPVPNVISNQCRIRISSVDGTVADGSDQSFSIIKNSSESLKIVSPVGGENWEAGTAKQIKWFSSGLDSVKIEYTTDNGNHWNRIAIDKKNTGIYYWEPVPNTPSTLSKIRIMDAKDGDPATESPNTFSILPEPKLIVLKPNGGETLLSGGSRKIEWISQNIENVKIAYSTDNGAKWNTIVESTPSIGFYDWTKIPDLVSQNCKIRIYDSKDGQPNDESDSVFTITNQITQIIEVESPNGGERWQAGTAQNITWNSSGVTKVKIEYTVNNGIEWTQIIDQLPNTGAYEWNVPNSLSTQCLIRISDSQDGDPIDQSNSRFSIVPKPELKILSPNGGEVWTAGQVDTIRWFSVGIENVRLEYSTNNGSMWLAVVNKTESDGIYATSFSVPTNQYKIRISETVNGSPVDESDGVFTVTDQPIINVVVPNGGEEWYSGSSDNIIWTSSNIEDVKIEYTINNGANWKLITSSTPSDGVYSWNSIPNDTSVQSRIRISDAKDGIPSDISDGNFSIVNKGTQVIKVTAPNGGEKWASGSRQDITWTASGISNVKIEYTINNGIIWLPITASTPSDGFYTWDAVPGTASTNCKIRISDASDGFPSDDSDQFFTIDPEPSVKVLAPNGGESWLTGTNQVIRWTSESVANVKIELTIDGGANWINVVSSIQSTGSYKWDNIPNLNSLQCKIRISDADDGTPFDLSDANFEITNQIVKSLQVLSPNGGENFEAGTKQNITWNSSGVSKVKIELTTDKGAHWIILADSVQGGAYEWNISEDVNSPQCQIRISDIKESQISDVSDGSFIISPKKWITVLGPQTKVYKSNEPVTITWQSGGIKNVGIKYTSTNGIADAWNPAFTNLAVVGAAVGSYSTYFSKPSDKYYVVVYNADEGSGGTPSNNSPGFTIIKAEPPAIKVVTPNGGEEWYAGSHDNIKWTSTNVENVKIEYTTDNGAKWTVITSSTPSNGLYAWNPIPNVFSLQCRIRVSNVADAFLSDISDSNFTINTPGNQLISLTSPNGGEEWTAGSRQDITWSASGITNVKIEYTTNNGINWLPIVASTPSDGFYTWDKVPSTASTNCKIRISDAADGSPSDDSNQFFTIKPEPSIKVLAPNGGEYWLKGTSQEIRWTSENLENVKIEFTTNGGGNWTTIINSTPSIGSYNWSSIPDLNSLQCKIRISDADDGTPFDMSDANFQISNQIVKSLQVIRPNGGEDWEAGTKQNITWNSSAVPTVKVELTTNQGASWTVLVDNVTGGAFEWNVNQTLNSTQCQIRISDATDNTISDISNGTFTISPIKSITVTAPVGPRTFKDSDPITITWESTGIKSVGIKYTTTNGIGQYPDVPEFYTLVSKIANQGTFTTSFSIPSSQYYVIVYNADEGADQAPSARSIGSFTIVKTETPEITLISPNGGEQWLVSQAIPTAPTIDNYHPYEIKWNATNINKVKIEWSTNGGGTWYVVPNAESTENDGNFIWAPGRLDITRPDSSDNCRIRITSADANVSAADETDGFFSIHGSKKIRVDFPNNEQYFTTDNADRYPMDIRWTSYAVTTVDIYYSLDNGVTWLSIDASAFNQSSLNYHSTGAYEWDWINDPNVGTTTVSTLGRIKIVDHADNKVWDVNDAPFWLNKRQGQGY